MLGIIESFNTTARKYTGLSLTKYIRVFFALVMDVLQPFLGEKKGCFYPIYWNFIPDGGVELASP